MNKEVYENMGASLDAIQKHYDLSNDFYRLWLDSSMVYSCALWNGEDDTLEAAQNRKLNWIAAAVKKADAHRVLDIGCGWGGLLSKLVDEYGVTDSVGLTLSETQKQYIDSDPIPNTEILIESWENHETSEPYQAIVSVGAFEHFAKPEMASDEKIDAYRKFFKFCQSSSTSGAPLVLQSICYASGAESTEEGRKFFMEVFPESDCPRLFEMVRAAEGIYNLDILRDDRLHYSRTLNQWLRRLRKNEDQAIEIVGKNAVETYMQYLKISSLSFYTKSRGLLRTVWSPVSS